MTVNPRSRRQEFTEKDAQSIAQKAMLVCSNPNCMRFTGYGTTEGKPRAIAEAAHIVAASMKGPRGTRGKRSAQVRKEVNGIWLCSICHKKIDHDPIYYSSETLQGWKANHENIIRTMVGKDLATALLDLRNQGRYPDECRELLSFFESKRVLYEMLDYEFPPRVIESLAIIRERVVQTRAKVNPQSPVFGALNRIQTIVNNFLREIGPQTDLRSLQPCSGDPVWCRFSEKLVHLRSAIVIIMEAMAGHAGYKLTLVKKGEPW